MVGHVAQSLVHRLVDPAQRGSEADIHASVRDLLLHGGLDLADAHVRMAELRHFVIDTR